MISVDLIRTVRSGVAQIFLERNRDRVNSGTAFLVDGGLVTNSHVIRSQQFDAIAIRFEDMPIDGGIRLSAQHCFNAMACESTEDERDYGYLELEEPEFRSRHRFQFGDSTSLQVGQQIMFLGFPFSMEQLTSHLGYVSSLQQKRGVQIIQIDGSVNGGNSGGPLLELQTGRVVGIITRAITGFVVAQFDRLIETLGQNIEILRRSQGSGLRGMIGGIDPVAGLLSSQVAMREIAINLRRSANVGIGYAYSSNYVRDDIARG